MALLVDGGIISTTNVDVAVEAGAKFIVVVNPLVPYVNDFETKIPTVFGSRVGGSRTWAPAIGNQAFRLLAHARLHLAVQSWNERFPDVDIILIERVQRRVDVRTSILDYSARLQIAKHGFESVTVKLARDYQRYKEIAARHGIEISARRVQRVDTVGGGEGDLGLAPCPRADHRRAAPSIGPGRGGARVGSRLARDERVARGGDQPRRCTSQAVACSVGLIDR